MDKSDVVIIGGVACGPKTAATLARRNGNLKITLFQKEKEISYGTCGMPYFASGDINSFDELTKTGYGLPRDTAFFKNTKGINVETEAEVVQIDRASKIVTVKKISDGERFEHGYDKLVIATGATPTRPPFEIPESPKIRAFTRPEDARTFRRMAESGQIGKAVIIGGGFIGCELAEAAGGLWGIEVTLIERERQILPWVLDPEMAAIAERELKRQDIELITGASVTKVTLDGNDNPMVHIDDREPITADFVFVCVGVTPESKLARGCGLATGATGGIIVDDHMRTLDENIYAGGDCVESINKLTGRHFYIPMGSLANRHGRVIAENICGTETKFPEVLGSFLVKIFDYNVGAVGISQSTAGENDIDARAVWGSFPDKPDYYPEYATMTLKLIYEPGTLRVLGLQAVGKGDICRRVDSCAALMQFGATLHDVINFEHGYAPPYSEALDPLHHLAAMAVAQEAGYKFTAPGTSPENSILLDVRDKEESEAQPWSGSEIIYIPLNDLRARTGELDKSRNICIICHRGPRSYQAAVILKQAGFEKVTIAGGGYTAAYL